MITNIEKVCRLTIGKLRRQFLLFFKRDEVETQIATRSGKCHQCANCCRLVFRCPFLTSKNLCLVYHSKARPGACAYFPIDSRDIKDVEISCGLKCGYFFAGEGQERP